MTAVATEVPGTSHVDRLSSRYADMIRIPGGTFRMGSDKHYAEEALVHRVAIDAFWIDRTPVTNREFREFEGDRPCHLRRDRTGS
jgi:formylglycine-generating enzyme required for sulfatase activity